jgi:ArsR family transcriptional regulator, arsenate/arsenite/antimonite-responsive transcriptional repressor
MESVQISTNYCCPPLLAGDLTAAEIAEVAVLFRVLGEPSRLLLLNAIAAQPSGEVCACELVESLGLSQPTVSHHLRVLYESELLTKERRGNWIYYQIARDRLAFLRKVLGGGN